MKSDEGKKTIIRRLAWFVPVAILSALPGLLYLWGLGIETGVRGYRHVLVTIQAGEAVEIWDHHLVRGAMAYTVMEWTVALLTMATAILAYAHFHVRRDAISMVVCVAAFWMGVLTTFQLLAFHGYVVDVIHLREFVQFNWTISQLFIGAVLLTTAAFVVWQGNRQDYIRDRHMAFMAVVFSVIAYGLIVWTAKAQVLPVMTMPEGLVTRPLDLIPFVMFAVAVTLALPLMHRRCRNPFSLALWLSAFPLAASQIYMAIVSQQTFDTGFTAAQLTKTMAFAIIFGGLVWDYSRTCRSETSLKKKLSISDRRIRLLFNNAVEAIIIFDSNRRVISWNRRATEIFGRTSSEAEDEDVLEMMFPRESATNRDGRERLRHQLQDYARYGDKEKLKVLCETSVQRTDGRRFTVEYSLVSTSTNNQTVFAVLARDITHRKDLQLRISQVDRLAAVGTLAAGVVHEIKNPLTYVLSNLGLVREYLDDLQIQRQKWTEEVESPDFSGWQRGDLEQLEELIDEIEYALESTESGAERIQRIIDDMRTFSQSRPGEMRPVSVIQTLESAIRMTRGELHRQARIETDFEHLPPVLADKTRLSQVFINLIVNAMQAMERKATNDKILYIETTLGNNHQVVIRFRDNGPGMSETIKSRIFQPFFTTKPPEKGTGLGLSLSRAFIEEFGGQIEVESAPGQGTTFEIRLPVHDQSTDQSNTSH